MALTDRALAALEEEYHRLMGEAMEFANELRRRREEVATIAELLRANGRLVRVPTDGLLGFGRESYGVDAAQRVWPFDGAADDDDALRAAIMMVMPDRSSGYKPSEMSQRLAKRGFAFMYDLPMRVARMLSALESEGLIIKRHDGRYAEAGTVQQIQIEDMTEMSLAAARMFLTSHAEGNSGSK